MFENVCYVVCCFLSVVGFFAFLEFLYDTFRSPAQIIWNLLFRRSRLTERYGPWAVITGSSDGIGRQYALNLARAGLNVVLISRTESKLQQVAQEIRSECNVEVRWLAVDFSDGPQVYDRIRMALVGLEIGILVNNVGFVHEHPVTVDKIPKQEVLESFSVNMYPTVMLVHMLLPDMKRRGRGIVINVSSASGHCALPYGTVYGASKAFLNSFSQGLQEELQDSGVECQLVIPLLVNTNLSAQWQTRSFTRSASVEVEAFGRTVTWLIGKTDFTTGCRFHALQATILKLFPRWFISKGLGKYLKGVKIEANKGK
ncbi:very-long-chain 3-oxoacyl-CoA reductase-like [Ochlerotatus camptorhynchus]|uniref:very-long-chain 3-oxoacyl-CoA reductase-like n=1 Tax=Ochlerotatus camptorhynchus TaxID=644619 RepID=UPI0031CFCEEB